MIVGNVDGDCIWNGGEQSQRWRHGEKWKEKQDERSNPVARDTPVLIQKVRLSDQEHLHLGTVGGAQGDYGSLASYRVDRQDTNRVRREVSAPWYGEIE